MLKTFKRKDGKSPYYYISGTVRDGRKVVTINAESTGKIKKSDLIIPKSKPLIVRAVERLPNISI